MKLADYLNEQNLRQEEFAARLGVEQATVSRYLSGKRMPTRRILEVIVEITSGRVTPNDFMGGAPSQKAPSEASAAPR